MIDFQNASFLKLRRVKDDDFEKIVAPLLIGGEQVLSAYRTVRDGVVFTTHRIMAINVQGVTGKKKDITSIPYKKIQTYSIESAGVFDLDSELIVWISGLGMVNFEFTAHSNVTEISQHISACTL